MEKDEYDKDIAKGREVEKDNKKWTIIVIKKWMKK